MLGNGRVQIIKKKVKLLLIRFYNSRDIVGEKFVSRGQTINDVFCFGVGSILITDLLTKNGFSLGDFCLFKKLDLAMKGVSYKH